MNDTVNLQIKLDAFKGLRDQRLEEQKRVDELKKKENELQNELLAYLSENPEVNGIIGATHKAILKTNEVPIITDYDAFKQYIVDQGAWDLATLLKPSAPAVRERWEDEIEIPGIEPMEETKLSITKI